MSEHKQVPNIKTWQERLQGAFYGHDEEIQCRDAETLELRAAYEALQKEVTHWKANHADLKARLRVATHRTDIKNLEVVKERLKLYDHLTSRIAELETKATT